MLDDNQIINEPLRCPKCGKMTFYIDENTYSRWTRADYECSFCGYREEDDGSCSNAVEEYIKEKEEYWLS